MKKLEVENAEEKEKLAATISRVSEEKEAISRQIKELTSKHLSLDQQLGDLKQKFTNLQTNFELKREELKQTVAKRRG